MLATSAKKQRTEVKLSTLTPEEIKEFEKAKESEIQNWVKTSTISTILRNQIPEEQILKCRWILTWKPLDKSWQYLTFETCWILHNPTENWDASAWDLSFPRLTSSRRSQLQLGSGISVDSVDLCRFFSMVWSDSWHLVASRGCDGRLTWGWPSVQC